MVGASSQQDGFSAETVLVDEQGTTFWKSELMKGKGRKEQYVEFQLAPNNGMRRVGSVEVFEARPTSGSDFRLDYSVDGPSWKCGRGIWGMESYDVGSVCSNDDLGDFEARSVRIVCLKPKSYQYKSEVGFAYVEFNRVANMRETGRI